MTAPRRPRSAWLLVGSTPTMRVKVHSAGQRLSIEGRRTAPAMWPRERAVRSSNRSMPVATRVPRNARKPIWLAHFGRNGLLLPVVPTRVAVPAEGDNRSRDPPHSRHRRAYCFLARGERPDHLLWLKARSERR